MVNEWQLLMENARAATVIICCVNVMMISMYIFFDGWRRATELYESGTSTKYDNDHDNEEYYLRKVAVGI